MEEVSHPIPAEVKPRSRADAFKALIKDRRVSNGAFRLWHFLETFVNYRRGDSIVWPSFRTIREECGFRFESIQAWIAELEQTGWLRATRRYVAGEFKRGGERQHNTYELLDGQGLALLKTVSHSASESGSAPQRYRKRKRSVTGTGSGALPKPVAESKGVCNTPLNNKESISPPSACGSAHAAQPQLGGETPFTAVGDWRKT